MRLNQDPRNPYFGGSDESSLSQRPVARYRNSLRPDRAPSGFFIVMLVVCRMYFLATIAVSGFATDALS